jgi:hypothetical protein
MAVLEKPPRYRSYLMAFWEERGSDPEVAGDWRFSLEDPHTGQRQGFACLDDLVAYLEQEIAPIEEGAH